MRIINEHLETTPDNRQRILTGIELFRIGQRRFGRFVSTLHDKDGPHSFVHYWRKVGAIT
ncbi:MAG: hypothetical protein H6797_02500 [Candidatus Nomurabacteria bacterium]|nr:MAG: hypothetical protein H6797_02500 [Candidatus Nomurabacteria bacterium]